eukprot:gene25209-32894_t
MGKDKFIKKDNKKEKRNQARKDEDFPLSDKLRDDLKELGVEVIDQKNGPSGWKFIDGSSKTIPTTIKLPDKKKSIDEVPINTKSQEITRNKTILNQVIGLPTNCTNTQGILIENVSTANGKAAKVGDKVSVYYTGYLKSNNKVFDSSTNKPFSFRLGRGEVIKGWDIGINGMTVGSKRKLTIPPEKAYGKSGAPPTIPPNATLIFDVSLIHIK